MKRTTLIAIALTLLIGAAPLVSAQLYKASGGHSSHILACFYECKAGPDVQQEETFQEVTSLMITNQGLGLALVRVIYLDAQQNFIGHHLVELGALDLDEVNVCHTLVGSGIPAPPAGLIEIVNLNQADPSGVKAWVKNIGGKFFHSNPEIFEGRVVGIGKTVCQEIAEPEVNDVSTLVAASSQSPVLTPVLIEESADPARPDLVPYQAGFATFCRLTGAMGTDLIVEILNQGPGGAGSTTTTVDFFAYGSQSQSTAAVGSGGVETHVFPVPPSCWDGDCEFRITVDAGGVEIELDETNNSVDDVCRG